MLWEIVLALLASAGVFFLVGCLLDICLPRRGGDVVLLYAAGGPAVLEQRVRRMRWRRSEKLILVDCGLDEEGLSAARILCREDWIEYCKAADLLAFLNGEVP